MAEPGRNERAPKPGTGGRAATWVVSGILALLLFAAASWFESKASFVLLYPGMALASLIWPEGVHSDLGGAYAGVLFYLTGSGLNLGLWTVLIHLGIVRCRTAVTRP